MTAWARVALATLLAATACGVRAQGEPVAVGPAAVPTGTAVARPVVADVYFVRGGRLVPVRRAVVAPGAAAQRLAALVAGPDAGTASYVTGEPVVETRAGVATVAVPAAFVRRDGDVVLLAAAQVVLTLTGSPDVAVVRFTSGGRPVAVPRAAGAPTPGPLTRADYAPLTG